VRLTSRRALASVYGFIVVYTLIVAGLGAISAIMDANARLEAAHQMANDIQSKRSIEHLTLALLSSSVVITNDGLMTSQLVYLHLVLPSTSTDTPLASTLSPESSLSITIPPSVTHAAVVTVIGNVFWTGPTSSAGNYTVTFDIAGLSSAISNGALLTVDNQNYSLPQLPKSFSWSPLTTHSYSYAAGFLTGTGSRVGWSDTRGLATTRVGQVVVSQSGLILADYEPQYLLTILGGSGISTTPASPAGDGYYNQGTTVQVSTNYTWNTVAQQTRKNLLSFQVDGSTATSVPRAGSGRFSTVLSMNSPHTIQFNSVTQYYLQLNTYVPGSGAAPPLSATYLYYQSFSVSQALGNPDFETGVTSPWQWNSGSCGTGVIFGVETGLQRTGTFNAYASSTKGAGCIYQSFNLPPGSIVTSASGSAWAFAPNSYNPGAVIYAEVKVGNNLNTPSCDFSQTGSQNDVYTHYTASTSGPCPGSQVQFDFGFTTASTWVYWDDTSFSYSYNAPTSGTIQSSSSTFSVSSTSVSYAYSISYAFPSWGINRQLQATLPTDEALTGVSSPSCGRLTSSQYSLSLGVLTIPDATISSCGSTYALTALAIGSFSASQSGGQNGDDWYDSGSSASISATSTLPFVFSAWSGSPTISAPTSANTTLLMNSYYAVTSKFDVSS